MGLRPKAEGGRDRRKERKRGGNGGGGLGDGGPARKAQRYGRELNGGVVIKKTGNDGREQSSQGGRNLVEFF